MRKFLKRFVTIIVLFLCCSVFESCAMIFSVSSPNLTQSEYDVLRVSNPKMAQCYESHFRGGMLALDLLFWPFMIVDALGGHYTYYAYEPEYCQVTPFEEAKPAYDPWGQPAEVAGNVKGADKRTLAPVQGAFSCTPEDNPDGGYVFRAPRQKDNSLILNRWSADGEELPPILLGQLIQKAGFDWTAENLGDVSILADLPAQTFQITVQDWYGPVTMTVTY